MKSESIHRVASAFGLKAHYDGKIKTWTIGHKVFTVAEIGKMAAQDLRKVLNGTARPKPDARKRPKATNESKPRSAFDPEAKITLLVKDNPKRGKKSHAAFALYRDGMTVSEFIGGGGGYADLRWDVKHKFINVTK